MTKDQLAAANKIQSYLEDIEKYKALFSITEDIGIFADNEEQRLYPSVSNVVTSKLFHRIVLSSNLFLDNYKEELEAELEKI